MSSRSARARPVDQEGVLVPEMWGVWPLEADGVTNSACCLQMHAKQGLPAPSPCRQQKQFKASDPQACDGLQGKLGPGRCRVPPSREQVCQPEPFTSIAGGQWQTGAASGPCWQGVSASTVTSHKHAQLVRADARQLHSVCLVQATRHELSGCAACWRARVQQGGAGVRRRQRRPL